MWGPLVWDLLALTARACDDLPPDPPERRMGPRRHATRAFVMLAYALRHVLPCSFCRTSYRHYIEDTPPAEFVVGSDEAAVAAAAESFCADDGVDEAGAVYRSQIEAADRAPPTLLDWVWIMHDRVNCKLGVSNMLTRRRFRKRMRVTTALMHPADVWDMLTIVALNYVVEPPSDAEDPEQHAKRTGHAVFLGALERLLPLVPDLGTLSPYVEPRRALAVGALSTRALMVAWVRAEKRRWMRDTGADQALCARMLAAESAYMASVA